MDQTRSVDRSKPIGDQFIFFLKKRFEAPGVIVGGEEQYFKKAAMGLVSIASSYFHEHPEELKPYVDD